MTRTTMKERKRWKAFCVCVGFRFLLK